MSGQPVNKPLDAEKFRKAYLKTLTQQEANNQKNLMANRLFAKTGVPQQPMDTRTVEERLMDTQRMKVDVRSGLLTLMDGTNAEKVVQNASPTQLFYMAQGLPYLLQTLKPKFKYGMYAESFLYEVDKYIASMNKDPFESKDVLLREDIRKVNIGIDGLQHLNRDLWRSLKQSMNRLEANSISRADLEQIASMSDPERKAELEQMVREKVADQPTKAQFFGDFEGIMARDQTGDIRGENDSARRFMEVVDGATEGLVVTAELPTDAVAMATAEATTISGYRPVELLSNMRKNDLEDYLDEILNADQYFLKRLGTSKAKLKEGKSYFTKQQLVNFLTTSDEKVRSLMTKVGRLSDRPLKKAGRKPDLETPPITPVAEPLGGNPEGMGIKRKPRMGSGIAVAKKKNYNVLQDSDIDWKSGVSIPKVARYIPFGRFVINKKRLGEGIISVRTPCGACLNDIKSERVSPKITSAINVILGGGSPTYDDISSMSEAERNYLHHLTSRANLIDRLSIPAPDKKKDEQDINQFEIMKGQIMSGNDSSKLHKDFKLLIIRLMGKKLLPKRQATDLLLELATLGY